MSLRPCLLLVMALSLATLAPAQTNKSATASLYEVVFSLFAPDAKHVSLASDFAGGLCPMHESNGEWRTTIQMRPGRYEYKFVVDGKWIADPDNPQQQYDGSGGSNSVLVVGQDATIQSVEIIEYGIYWIDRTGEHVPMTSTAAGAVEPAARVRLLATTNVVPAVVGTTFGCRFLVKGEPDGAPVKLEIAVKHPPFPRPEGLTSAADRVPYSAVIGQDGAYTYTFDNNWAAAPGKWSIQVWYDGKKLAEQDFVVQPKRQ